MNALFSDSDGTTFIAEIGDPLPVVYVSRTRRVSFYEEASFEQPLFTQETYKLAMVSEDVAFYDIAGIQ